jgi:hypothetical protein
MIVSKTNSANARPKAWNEHTTNLDRLELTLASIVAFLAPINAARLPGIYITYADIIAVLCILLMIFNRGLPNRFLGPMTGAYLAGLFLFCGALIISTIVNGDVVRGAIGIGQYLVAYLIFPIVLLRRSAREAMIITYAFLAAIAVVCLHGIIIISFNIDAGLTYISYSQRLRGLVERENEFGALLAMSAPLVIALGRAKLIHPMIAWVGLGGMLYTVMLTGSNTGIICFVIAFFAMMMTGKNVLRDGFFVLFLLSALLFAVGFFGVEILPNVFERRVVAAFNEGSISKLGTFAGRMELNGEALQLATNHLFAGAGFDQYREISPHGAPVHNVYLLVLVEGGFIALSGLLLILFALFGFASLAMSYPKTFREGLCLAITVLVFTIAISALPHIYARFLVLPWIVTMGLAMNISDLRSRNLSIADGFKKTDERSNRST